MAAIKIDKGVPFPDRDNERPKWPWHAMDVGDSFFAAGYVQTVAAKKRGGGSEKIMATAGGRNVIPGSGWALHNVTENGVRGVRVWRTR
jgi:hypothetical protein